MQKLHAVATAISVLLAVSVNGLNIGEDRVRTVPVALGQGVAERASSQESEEGHGMHTLGRTLQQEKKPAAACTVESAIPDSGFVWYTVVDKTVLYTGAVNASNGIDLRCATNPTINTTGYCSPGQPTWRSDRTKDLPLEYRTCTQCQIAEDQVLGSTQVRGLINGNSSYIRLPPRYCSQLVLLPKPAPPPASRRTPPAPATLIGPPTAEMVPLGDQDEKASYAYTIMADSAVDRWITATTCDLTELDTVMTVRGGCQHNGPVLATGDDYCGQQTQIAFKAEAGIMYTVFLKQFSRECFSQPNITFFASEGSNSSLTGRSFLISPVQKPGMCLTGNGAGEYIDLQPCNSSSLKQTMYLKAVGNGEVFLRNSYWGAGMVIAPQYSDTTRDYPLILSRTPSSISTTPLQEKPPPDDGSFFSVRKRGNNTYELFDRGFGWCVMWLPQSKDGATFTIELCSDLSFVGSADQEFVLIPPTGSTPTELMGETFFVSLFIAPSMCWEAGTATDDPAIIDSSVVDSLILNFCNKTAKSQKFLVRNAGNGFVHLVTQGDKDERVLELPAGSQVPDDKTFLQMGNLVPGSYFQMWSLMKMGNGVYSVSNALTALCVDNPDSRVQAGLPLQQFACTGQRQAGGVVQNVAQSFVFTSANPRPPSPPPRPPPPPPLIINSPSPPNTSVPTPAPSPPAGPGLVVTASNGGSDGQVNTGVIIGAVVGVVVGVLLLGLLLGWFLARRKRAARAASFHKDQPDTTTSKEGVVSSSKEVAHPAVDVLTRQKLHIKGLVKGEPFLRGAAPHFTWSDLVPGPSCQAVEEGITALHLDMMAITNLATEDKPTGAPVPTVSSGDQKATIGSVAAKAASGDDKVIAATGSGVVDKACLHSPVIRLSSAEVTQQIELLKEGLMGRGATALVFKCRWPSRFGPNALLAAKVLKDPFQGEQSEHLQAFMYEARVLEELRHRNIVRIYGYCVEPPTVCLIMELLPSSLKARMTRTLHVTPQPSSLQMNISANSQAKTQQITARPYTNDLIMPQQRSKESKDQMDHMTPKARRQTNDLVDHVCVTVSHMTHVTPEGSRRTSATGTLPDSHVIAMMTQPHDPHVGGNSNADGTTLTVPLVSTRSTGKTAVTTPNHLNHLFVTSSTRSDGLDPSSMISMPLEPVNSQPPQHTSVTSVVGDSFTLEAASLPSHLQSPWATATAYAVPPTSSAVSMHGAPPRLTMLEVLQLSTDIAAGLAYLHQKPSPELDTVPSTNSSVPSHQSQSGCGDGHSMIVHRDIKPDNVLVNSEGVAKICDFGLARVHDSTTIYSVHVAVGTLRYMAPELLDGETNKPMTDRVDLYSLGMMMWEMVAAEVPWKGLTDPQIMTAVQLKKRPSMVPPTPLPSLLAQRTTTPTYKASSASSQPQLQPTLDNNNDNNNNNTNNNNNNRRSSLSGSTLQFNPTLEDQPSTFTSEDGTPSRQISAANTWTTNSITSATGRTVSGGLTQRGGSSSSSQSGSAARLGPPGAISADLPASFDAVPQFKTLISACWQHNNLRRPTAQGVHKLLANLLRQYQPVEATTNTSNSSSGKA